MIHISYLVANEVAIAVVVLDEKLFQSWQRNRQTFINEFFCTCRLYIYSQQKHMCVINTGDT